MCLIFFESYIWLSADAFRNSYASTGILRPRLEEVLVFLASVIIIGTCFHLVFQCCTILNRSVIEHYVQFERQTLVNLPETRAISNQNVNSNLTEDPRTKELCTHYYSTIRGDEYMLGWTDTTVSRVNPQPGSSEVQIMISNMYQ
ncbi:hypothetical protein L208DRAFT_1395531 [Tricholoma matsutake]|nr:hypothetical protein L208DRAFT_1395531 [Tricholoma matsutake 945]